jgi:A/G-specific adenine glycosylase
MKFSNTLIHWYLQKRDLPWRGTTNPYAICSEIMLQQTALLKDALFLAFSAAFPTVFDFIEANEEEVLNCGGLGYYLVLESA